jgi:hypothetical protein
LQRTGELSPEPATKAILQGEFTPTNINVTGKRFNIGEINYVVTEQITPEHTRFSVKQKVLLAISTLGI